MSPTKTILAVTAQTRGRIPEHRRKQQVVQTIQGVGVALLGLFAVRYFALHSAYNLAAILLGLRVASREFLMDCLKIAGQVVGLLGGKVPTSPEPDSRTDDERGAR